MYRQTCLKLKSNASINFVCKVEIIKKDSQVVIFQTVIGSVGTALEIVGELSGTFHGINILLIYPGPTRTA